MDEVEPTPARPDALTPGGWKTAFPSLWALVAAFLVCVVVPASLITVHIHENPRLSPVDEGAQFDYVSRIAHGSLPRLGQRLLPSTLHLISCTGSAFPVAGGPPCPGSKTPNDYLAGGYQYEAQQPPTYYAATAAIRWVGVHVLGVSSLTAARLGGVFWVALGLLALWIAAALLAIPLLARVIAMLLLASAPVVIYQSSIVSNDAPALFAGSVVALVGVWAWRRQSRWTAPVLFVTAFVATSFKLDNGLAPVVVAGVLAVTWHTRLRGQDSPTRTLIGSWVRSWGQTGGALLLGTVTCAVVWVVLSRHLNLIDPRHLPSFDVLRNAPVTVGEIAREALTMFNPLGGSYDPARTNAAGTAIGPAWSLNLQPITSTLVTYLLIGAGLAGIFATRRTWAHVTGLLSMAALYIGGIVLGVALWRTYNSDPSLSGRYGLSVAPLLVLALVALLKGKWLLRTLGLWAGVLTALGFVYILAS